MAGHYPAPNQALSQEELELFKEIAWLVANLCGNEAMAFEFINEAMPKHFYMIARTFHPQFSFKIWRVVLWAMRMMV